MVIFYLRLPLVRVGVSFSELRAGVVELLRVPEDLLSPELSRI